MTVAFDSHGGALGPSDLHAIREVVQQAHQAQGDVEDLVALHVEGAVIVNIAGRRVIGAAAFAEAMRAALHSSLRDVRTTVEIIDVRPLSADAAVVSCTKTVHDERADAAVDQQEPTRGALSYVVVKTDSGWRIGLAQTTPLSA